MTESEFVSCCAEMGGRVYIAGGWVRDSMRGVSPHDKDYVVCGIEERDFVACFPNAKKVGKSFPVFLVIVDGEKREVAFARKERKSGTGYHGFAVDFDKNVTIEEDLFRRDTTMNAIAVALPSGDVIDPYGGRRDIEGGVIRPVSEHFIEDPVRALRAARQAAELKFRLLPETIGAMRACADELKNEPSERIFGEMNRAMGAERPSIFFRALMAADLLRVTFPELHDLIGKTQPIDFHPEGDAFEHSMLVLDVVAKLTDSKMARFAALTHDIGKGTTPMDMLPHHYGHEQRGLEVIERWNERMTLPRNYLAAAKFVIKEHMRTPWMKKPSKQVRLLLDIEKSPLAAKEYNAVIFADSHGLPPYLARAEEIIPRLKKVTGKEAPAELKGKKIGDWILSQQIKIFMSMMKE